MRAKILLVAAALSVSAGLWAGSVTIPGSDTNLAFSSSQFGVLGCGTPCSVSGTQTNGPYMLTWSFDFTNPMNYIDSTSTTGHFQLGTMATPGTFSFTDNYMGGATITGNVINPPIPDWTSNTTDTILRFEVEVSTSSVPGGDPLINYLTNHLGDVPAVNDLLVVQLDVTCGTFQCTAPITPQDEDQAELLNGTITGGTVSTNGSATPEPATIALLAGGIGFLALKRRFKK